MKKLLTLLFSLLSLSIFAQTAIIKGNIIDKANPVETIIGATVVLEGTSIGNVTDFDGNYEIVGVPAGKYTLVASYVGYKPIKQAIELTANQTLTLDFTLELEATVLEGVIVVGKANREAASALSMLQQRSTGMLTGVSSQEIAKSPDRTTGDVLKRVSGTTVQDNKFVVVRGLADRYNVATINGQMLPSTEPDKRAFSFDLFPSNVLSNLLIYKTATPDLPGEFAGGVIQVNTKEVADDPFMKFSIGYSYNTQSTLQPYQFYKTGSTDFLGFDNKTRALDPAFTKSALDNPATSSQTAKLIPNDWALNNYGSMMPSQNYQLSAGTTKQINGRPFGVIGAITYTNQQRIIDNIRADYVIDKTRLYAYNDMQYRKDITAGAMLNLAYKLNDNNKLTWNNLLSSHGDDQTIIRDGEDIEQTRYNRSYSYYYNSTILFTSQLMGEHVVGEKNAKLKWAASFNNVARNTPSYRRLAYFRNYDAADKNDYIAYIPAGAPSPNYAGRFYSDQNEQSLVLNTDFTLPYFAAKSEKNYVKIGAFADIKDRTFDARVMGYTRALKYQFANALDHLPIDKILATENISDTGFTLQESTNPNDSYDANSALLGGFVMAEQYVGKLRMVGGVRVENFNQQLNTFTYSGDPVKVNNTTLDVLPSANLTYEMTEKSNFRLSASQTVSRPNFRELAPFSFYDFNLSAAIIGNPELKRTKVLNLDAKYEWFPMPNQSISLTGFYKKFDSPIEQFYESSGAGTKTFNFKNAVAANNFGVEIETRTSLEVISKSLKDFSLFGNLSLIQSKIDVSNDALSSINATERPLQGQSPYIVNTGLTYQNPNYGFGATILYNKIGRRIWLVGSNGYLDTYENPRNLLDVQITQKILKNGELKLNIQDIFNNEAIFYQDQNANGKFDEVADTKIIGTKFGSNISLSFSYKF